MSNCCKRVVYLSCMESGSRVKGAGFIKVEHQRDEWTFDMHISGMAKWPEKKYEICAVNKEGGEYRIGSVFLHRGCGEWKWEGKSSEPVGGGIFCDEIARFIVRISEDKVVEGKLQSEGNETEEEAVGLGDTAETGESRKRKMGRPEFMAAEKWKRGEETLGLPAMPSSAGKKEGRRGLPGERVALAVKREGGKYGEADGKEQGGGRITEDRRGLEERKQEGGKGLDKIEKEIRMEEMILDDKWEQLRRMYPIVHPYEDEREYISIQPKDFVVMTGDYQHLANNSFLLHGFYNYRHIVLGKERRGGEARGDFYLGVPGVYYEREKMVALMFGFEAFECCGGKAESGKFGYYLRRVKI